MTATHDTSSTRPAERRRLRRRRTVALSFPFVVLLLLEIFFRGFGVYDDPGFDKFQMEFEPGTKFFPEWNHKIQQPKPPDTYRIFVLGGSSAMGFGVTQPFSVLLQEQLTHPRPKRSWEVINGSVGAYGSHRILAILKRACQFDPDLIVIYMGHNEFLEEVFFHPEGLVARLENIGQFARQFRVANWLRALLPEMPTFRPKLQRHFLGNTNFPLIRSPEQYDLRIQFLASNLSQMIEYSRVQDVGIVLIPAVANLLTSPGDSVHNAAYRARANEWDALFARAKSEADAGRWAQSLASFDALHAIDDQYAHSRFALGTTLLAKGDRAQGQTELLAANQYDKRGIRANSDVLRTIFEVCERASVPAIDLREQFYGELTDEFERARQRRPLKCFLDHCHPTQRGHKIIADAILDLVLRRKDLNR